MRITIAIGSVLFSALIWNTNASAAGRTGEAENYTQWRADADWNALQAIITTQHKMAALGVDHPLPWPQYYRDTDQQMQDVSAVLLEFYSKHPTDPRRWEAVMYLRYVRPRFYTDMPFAGDVGTLHLPTGHPAPPAADANRQAEWQREVSALETAMTLAKDVPENVRERLARNEISEDLARARVELESGRKVDLKAMRTMVDSHLSKFSSLADASYVAGDYMWLFDRYFPEASDAEWAHLLESPNIATRELAKGHDRFAQLRKTPIDFNVTGLRGEQLELSQLRGKVVLIDFWATWCTPCMNEMPNLQRIYQKYRAQGFEVIGVSADSAPKEGAVSSLAKTADQVRAFLGRHQMEWPQFYDGKGTNNELVKRFGVYSFPTTLLLGPDGKVVKVNAMGDQLEPAVRKALGLSTLPTPGPNL